MTEEITGGETERVRRNERFGRCHELLLEQGL
jgi:hypothetical protein